MLFSKEKLIAIMKKVVNAFFKKETAEKIMRRHNVLTKLLISLGVDEETAAADACKMEHVISDETFEAIHNHMQHMEQ